MSAMMRLKAKGPNGLTFNFDLSDNVFLLFRDRKGMDSNFTPFFRKNHGKHTAIVFSIICNCGSSKNFLSIDVFEYKKIGVSFPHTPL